MRLQLKGQFDMAMFTSRQAQTRYCSALFGLWAFTVRWTLLHNPFIPDMGETILMTGLQGVSVK